MLELEVTWKRVAAVWWLVLWRSLLGSVLLGGVFGFVIGFVAAMAKYDVKEITPYISIAGGLIGLAWGFVVFGLDLRKRYSGFRLALVPTTT